MEPSDDRDDADYSDPEAAEMGRILVLGAAVGVPLVFFISLGLIFVAGVRGVGSIFVAAWAALIGGTFIGAGILLAAGGPQIPRAVREDLHTFGHRRRRHRPIADKWGDGPPRPGVALSAGTGAAVCSRSRDERMTPRCDSSLTTATFNSSERSSTRLSRISAPR
jgi:hypothetical protein